MSYYVVATYYRDQQYGGPEEGGWWYSTYELKDVIDGAPDESGAWALASDYNEQLADGEQPRATVVELGRRELKPKYEHHACHAEIGEYYDEETLELRPEYSEVRWDVPVFTPEHRPHYC